MKKRRIRLQRYLYFTQSFSTRCQQGILNEKPGVPVGNIQHGPSYTADVRIHVYKYMTQYEEIMEQNKDQK